MWDKLSADEQKALTDCAAEGQKEQRTVSRALSSQSLANVKAQGMQVNEITPSEQKRMRDAVKPVYERAAATVGKDTVDRIQADLGKIRGTN